MKNKLGYVIIICCIFLISGGTCNVYAYNVERRTKHYTFGTPDYAEGIDLVMEVTEYDKDEWRDHIGYYSEPDEIFYGSKYDADIEGAMLKSEILDWERKKDNIPFFSDFVLTAEQKVEDIPEAENLNDVIDYIKNNINDFSEDAIANPDAEKPILYVMWLGPILLGWQGHPTSNQTYQCYMNATYAYDTALAYAFGTDYVNAKYNILIDGYNLHRALWYWTSKEFKKYPDVKRFDVPFIKDPVDWYNTYEILAMLKSELLSEVTVVVDAILALNRSFEVLKTADPVNWDLFNFTLADGLYTLKNLLVPKDQGREDYISTFLDAALNPTGENYFQNGTKGLYAVFDQIGNQIPGKFGFLWQLLIEGLPVLLPVESYLKDIVEAFDIDGRTVETGIKGLDPVTEIIGDVWVDGNTIILEFEYADPNEKRDGWKVEFTYDEYGIQELVVFSGSEIFYEQELHPSSLEQRIVSTVVLIGGIIGIGVTALVTYFIIHKLKKRKARKSSE